MDRRSVLKMVAATPFFAGGVKVAESMSAQQRVDLLSQELVAAMNELDGTRSYRCSVNPQHGFALICGDPVA